MAEGLQIGLNTYSAAQPGWGIKPKAVVGHSSGEIGAAAAAGLITPANAIKTAYYRGKAAHQVGSSGERVGMLAVGVSPETVERYLRPLEGKVQIACFNSPNSLTMSGTTSALEKLCTRLQHDGHFARLLLVDLAYHSDYMAEIADVYEQLLLTDKINSKQSITEVRMFSSVTGKLVPTAKTLDSKYWKQNMESPVQFTKAVSELLSDSENGANFLIEIGPSNALAGPIAQIKKTLIGGATSAAYTSTLKRGSESVLSLFDTAGRLLLQGGSVNLASVNGVIQISSKLPNVIVDLPNYSWNKSIRYWHETRASKDWRFKKFINHDLIGSKINGTSWQAPIFKKVLKLVDIPWLKDHKLGSQVVFPGAAYVTMAVEALYQTTMIMQWEEQEPARYRFRLRDVQFNRALVLEENEEIRLTISLTPVKGGSIRSWYEYKVCSLQDTHDDHVHSTGLVCIETDYQNIKAPTGTMEPLKVTTPSRVWYKALADSGYNFGPCFQKHLMLEMNIGQRNSRSLVNLEPPQPSPLGQSQYPMHPAVMDGCLQTGAPSLWKGDPSASNAVLVPRVIDSLVITAGRALPIEGITLSSAKFLGVGDPENARNYATNVSLYDPKDGSLLFEMKGLSSSEIETSEDNGPGHTFTSLLWNTDVDMMMAADATSVKSWCATQNGPKTSHDVIDLIAHKKPGLKVLELNMSPEDKSSLWIDDQDKTHPIREACSQYHFAVCEPKTLISARENLPSRGSVAQFHLLDTSKPLAIASDVKFDLAIIKKTLEFVDAGVKEQEIIIQSLIMSIREGGFVLAIGFDEMVLGALGRVVLLTMQDEKTCICQLQTKEGDDETGNSQDIIHISLFEAETQDSFDMTEILNAIDEKRWAVQKSFDPLKVTSDQTVLILDELFASVMDSLNEKQWHIIKHLVQQRCRLLWVTSGAQLMVFKPTQAIITGLFRTTRAEEQLSFMTLDVEKSTGEATAAAISACLERLSSSEFALDAEPQPTDYEFVERGNVIRISRLCQNSMLTRLQSNELSARIIETVDIHDCETLVKLQCERLGNLDAIHFAEATSEPIPLEDGCCYGPPSGSMTLPRPYVDHTTWGTLRG